MKSKVKNLICLICGDIVPISELREHLEQHNAHAAGFEWADVRNQFKEKD